MTRRFADSPDPTRRRLAQLQRRAAFTRKAINSRRDRGLQTSDLEGRLAGLLHQIELLTAQLPPKRRRA
jgi:hypothetical protein